MIAFIHQWFPKVAPQSAIEVSIAPRLQGRQLTVAESSSPNKLREGTFNKTHTKKVALEVISECFLKKTHKALVGEV